MKVLLPKVIKRLWYVAAVIIILAALLVVSGRLLTPYLNSHLPDFEHWASEILKAPVSIGKVYVSWDVYEPEVTFDQVKFLDVKTQKPNFQIDHATVNLSIFRSLLARKPLVESITIAGARVTVHQAKSGRWNIEGLTGALVSDAMTGSSLQGNAVLAWIFSIPKLRLQDVNVLFYPEVGQNLSFSVMQLALQNGSTSHTLSGRITLNQAIPTKLTLFLTCDGDLTDLTKIKAHVYVYLEAINLPQWIGRQVWHDLQVKQGLGSLKVWADWDKNTWQKVQSRMQFYDLEVQSIATKKTQVVTRFNGEMGWRQDGDKQIFAGDQLFLDLPDHLWPVTSFFVQMIPDKNAGYFPEIVRVGYIDFTDFNKIISNLGFLPDNIQTRLNTLNPKGIIANFQFKNISGKPLTFPLVAGDDAKLEFNTEFSGLTINAIDTLPAISNLQGSLAWNGHEGDLKLNSINSRIRIKSLFPKELQFEHLTASLRFTHDSNGTWLLDMKNVSVLNADANVRLKMALSLPSNESPQLNMTGDFSIMQANHLVNYIPEKKLDPDFVAWLHQAFLKGQFDSGKIKIQGRIADIPFDNGKGKFEIYCDASNLDFNYAPEWPAIRHLSGALQFSGRKMTVDLHAGDILNVPINVVHAEIPYIGDDQPQILHVQASVKTDLSEILHFIHVSPLEKKIGSALGGVHFAGPSNLKLGLIIPVRKPKETKIQGDLDVSGAALGMSEGGLALKQLQGSIHFTEKDMDAKNLQGKLLNEDAVLNIITQHPAKASPYVQANLQTQLDLAEVQTLLKMPIASLAKGKAAVVAELHLYSQDAAAQASEVSIHSDLKGVTLNFPAPYGKKADDVRDLQMNILLQKALIRAKINYNKLLTAALDFQRATQRLHFYSGEVSLGGEASWQTQPGLLLSGNFKELNWETLQAKFTKSTTPTGFDTSFFRGINLNVGIFSIFGQQLNDAHILLTKQNNSWLMDIDSQQVAGLINVVLSGANPSITGKFERLYLKSAATQNKSILDPKNVPALSLQASDVRYQGKSLGAVTLDTVPTKSQMTIKELSVESPLVNLHAHGSWQANHGIHATHFSGTISTAQLSDLLKAWDAGSDNFVGSKGDINFDLTWPSTPYQPGVAGLSGDVSISLGAGRVINVGESNNAKMDLGRLLNLFSLSSIPRRLSLDFSDITQKGYGFDYIKGDFNLKNGNAYTQNAHSDGPVARVDIAGRIGLVAQDLNVTVGVTPHVSTSSLPAMMAFWNPIAAAATLIVGQVAGVAMSKSTLYHYTVTGSWNNPNWQASH